MWIPRGGIAFFDSGIGGLTVLNECRKLLPREVFYYYGDNKHAPYGNLSVEKIKKYVARAFKRFQRLRVRAVVLACNTATAVCIEELRTKYSFPIVGAEPSLLPAAKAVITEKGEGMVFVLTTRATYESRRLHALLEKATALYPKVEVHAIPCDNLAGKIEQNIFQKEKNYAPFLPRGKPSAVVLGCTHYVYIAEQIKRMYDCPIFDGNYGIALRLRQLLEMKKEQNLSLDPFRPPSVKNEPISHKKIACDTHRRGIKKRLGRILRKGVWSKAPILDRQQGRIYFMGSGKRRCKCVNKQTFV